MSLSNNMDIYQDEIKQLARTVIDAKDIEQPHGSARLDNRLCGDRIQIDLCCNGNVISQLTHKVRGCLLCEASANILAKNCIGSTAKEIQKITEQLSNLMTTSSPVVTSFDEPWQQLHLFSPVSEHKSRHQCILLPFLALQQAFDQISER